MVARQKAGAIIVKTMCFKTIATLLTACAVLQADTLVLHNGSHIEGRFLGGSDQTIQFAVGGRVNTFNISDVDSLRFTSGPNGPSASSAPPSAYPPVYGPDAPGQAGPYPSAPPPTANTAGGYPPAQQNVPPPYSPNGGAYPPVQNGPSQAGAYAPSQTNAPGPYGPNQYPPQPAPTGVQIPAGTQITVRLIDPVNSETDTLGQTYRASVDQPVFVSGQTVIPRGADVVAALIDAEKSGKIQGRTVLTLDLKTITLNGHPYDVVTTGAPQASDPRGKRSAEVIGGTAALGAIIGAIAGGGKGAAIGAGSGAAVGTAGQVLTSGQKVKIPAETRISFTLQNPLTL